MKKSEWIACDDRLPEYTSRDDTPCEINGKAIPPTLYSDAVLIFLDGGGVRTDKFTTIEGAPGWWNTYGPRVTHWMKTPDAPKDKS